MTQRRQLPQLHRNRPRQLVAEKFPAIHTSRWTHSTVTPPTTRHHPTQFAHTLTTLSHTHSQQHPFTLHEGTRGNRTVASTPSTAPAPQESTPKAGCYRDTCKPHHQVDIQHCHFLHHKPPPNTVLTHPHHTLTHTVTTTSVHTTRENKRK